MERTENRSQVENSPESRDVPEKEEEDCMHRSQKEKSKRKRNSSFLSYVEVISYAILSSPHKKVTLSEIYSFIQDNYPGFTENRPRWKNTVRHNLSLHQCFQRSKISKDKAGCYWKIHPSFLVEFSRGDFSRRKLTESSPLSMEDTSSLHENQFAIPSPTFACQHCTCKQTPPLLSPNFGLLQYHRQGLPFSYGQHPYFLQDYWIY